MTEREAGHEPADERNPPNIRRTGQRVGGGRIAMKSPASDSGICGMLRLDLHARYELQG